VTHERRRILEKNWPQWRGGVLAALRRGDPQFSCMPILPLPKLWEPVAETSTLDTFTFYLRRDGAALAVACEDVILDVVG